MLGKRKVPARAYVAQFNFKGPDQEKKVGNLSGGERNRVHLAKLLKSGGNLLLLDEPTNDLDVDMLRALEEALIDFGGCAVVISHDRWFLDRIATHILAFEGDSQVVWCDGNYQTYEAQRHERLGIDADQPHRIRYKALTRIMTIRIRQSTMMEAESDAENRDRSRHAATDARGRNGGRRPPDAEPARAAERAVAVAARPAGGGARRRSRPTRRRGSSCSARGGRSSARGTTWAR